jgi:tripartite-type tricarboxylate transporter receptor subunit TctC
MRPVAFLGTIPSIIYSRPNENYKDFRQALNYAKKQKLTMALAAQSPNFKLMKDIISKYSSEDYFVVVGFKNGSQPLMNVLGGHIDIGSTVIDAVIPELKMERVIPLAVIYSSRMKSFSEIPTLKDLGIVLENEDRYYNNFFLWANSSVSIELVTKVQDALVLFLNDKKSEEFRNSMHIQFGKNNIKNPEKYMEELLR